MFRKSVKGRKQWVFVLTRAFAKVFVSLVFRIEIQGTEHLPAKKAFVLLPKHQRWMDIPLLSLATPRPLYYVARHDLFDGPLSRWLMTSLGGIPLNRQRPVESRDSLRKILALLQHGEGVAIFPEGTYYRKKMGPGRVGVVRMVLSKARIPFIPVGIQYSHKGWRSLVRIRFGKPICAAEGVAPRVFLDHMLSKIADLSNL